ncbi:hypothetical protein QYG89_03725 [Bacillus sp. B190/17]|uniref:Inner spore coat protein n=1 Tax=Bacillus lumedeiriae TaxID=3058829 RepID=A0ABW8I5M9_9BACI
MYYFYPYGRPYATTFTNYDLHQAFIRPYPTVNTVFFKQSAQSMKRLLNETTLLLNKITTDNDFAFRLMAAAQSSNRQEVERLIRSSGMLTKAAISFNPDFFRLELQTDSGNLQCCKLAVSIRWNQ